MRTLKETRAITKEAAWIDPVNARTIPVNKANHKFKFTRRWFVLRNQKTFSTFLAPTYPPHRPINMIQIGVFEGQDLVWSLQNLLQHPDSRCVAIDPWAATRKLDENKMAEVEARARKNLAPWRRKVEIRKGYSGEVLQDLIDGPASITGRRIPAGHWDLVIIDGDHTADAVYTDATLSSKLIKTGGQLMFDDVRNRVHKKDHVYDGIVGWLLEEGNQFDLAWYHRYCNCYTKKA